MMQHLVLTSIFNGWHGHNYIYMASIQQQFQQFKQEQELTQQKFPTEELAKDIETPEQIQSRVQGQFAPTRLRTEELSQEETQGARNIVGNLSGSNLNTFNENFVAAISKKGKDRLDALDKEIKSSTDSLLFDRVKQLQDLKIKEFESQQQQDAQIFQVFQGLTGLQFQKESLELQKQMAGFQQQATTAQLTGSFNGTPTLEARQFESGQQQFQQQFGLQNQQFTEEQRQFNIGTEQQNKQFQQSFGEQQRQFDTGTKLENAKLQLNDSQFQQQFGFSKEQFVSQKQQAQKEFDLNVQKFGIDRALSIAQQNGTTIDPNTGQVTSTPTIDSQVKSFELERAKTLLPYEIQEILSKISSNGLDMKTKIDAETSLRKEVNSNPQIQDYNQITSKYTQMRSALEQALSRNDDKSKVAADQAIITLYNKILDPTSVVREGEYARSVEGQSAINYTTGIYERLKQGGSGLTDSDRQEMVDTARRLLLSIQPMINEKIESYSSIADNYGLDTKNIIQENDTSSFIPQTLKDFSEIMSDPNVDDYINQSVKSGIPQDILLEELNNTYFGIDAKKKSSAVNNDVEVNNF